MKINYLTSNPLKFRVAEQLFLESPQHQLIQHSFDAPEIQSTDSGEIARHSALYAAQKIGEPCVAMDASFSIAALGGFPGPFVKYVNNWLTEVQLLSLLADQSDRSAHFTDALAIGFPDGSSEVFLHDTNGSIAHKDNYVASKWPANSLFIPHDQSIPLGSMTEQAQVDFWQHENRTWHQLVAHLGSQ